MFLRSEGRICPDIPLPNNCQVVVGRGPLTGLKDKRVGRRQLVLTSNQGVVQVCQQGANASRVAGEVLQKGRSCMVKIGQCVELLEGKYRFFLMGSWTKTNGTKMPEKIDKSSDSKHKTAPAPPHPNVRPNWTTGLRTDMKKPERVVFSTSSVVVIKDKFPKAAFHFLILPREELDNLQSLKLEHVGLLEQMQEVGQQIATRHPDSQFRMGFHARPSMLHLHLHLISQDFDSVGLKTKRHWNSFTTKFFLPVEDVIRELKESGKVEKKDELAACHDLPLSCHKCTFKPKSMPELKKHIAKCGG